jgi:putative AlgH/UPF0301 family transcriptional regulator
LFTIAAGYFSWTAYAATWETEKNLWLTQNALHGHNTTTADKLRQVSRHRNRCRTILSAFDNTLPQKGWQEK